MTHRHQPRRTAAVLSAVVLAGLGVTVPAAAGVAATPSSITVSASDTSVAPGEQLVLSGRLSQPGVVRVVTKDGTSWTPLTGAVVHTRRDGTYAVRVVLSRGGDRVLRVVGNPDASGVGTSRARVVVHVS